MTDVATKPRPTRPGTSLRGFSAPLLLLFGLVIVPGALSLLSAPAGAPTDEDYVRMAFATVAGGTVAILTVAGLLADRIVRRAKASTIALFALGSALRAVSRDRSVVDVIDLDGTSVTGTVDAVGRDVLDLAEHPADLPRRSANVRTVLTVPFTAVAAVRRR